MNQTDVARLRNWIVEDAESIAMIGKRELLPGIDKDSFNRGYLCALNKVETILEIENEFCYKHSLPHRKGYKGECVLCFIGIEQVRK